jgi:HemY protein
MLRAGPPQARGTLSGGASRGLMKTVIWLVLLAVVAVVAATSFGRNDGLVSLYWNGWRVDLSLNLFVLGVVASCVALMAVLRALQSLLTLPERASAWRMQRRERTAQSALREALAEYFGARYSRAHKAAMRAVAIHEATPGLIDEASTRGLAHLLAAASLHRLQDRPQRDRQIAQLEQLQRQHRKNGGRSTEEALALLAAEWAIDDRDAPKALGLLASLPPGVARRIQALRLKLQAQRLAGDAAEALRSARLLAKHQAFTPGAAQGLLRSLAVQTLDAARDAEQLERAWQQLDDVDQADAYVAARAARRAAGFGEPARGRAWLLPLWERLAALGRDEREAVALALARNLEGLGPDWLPRLQAAEQALPQEAAVQAVVGSAYAERGLWGKARSPLERAAAAPALAGDARRECWRRLAALARAEGDEARALGCERQAMAIG